MCDTILNTDIKKEKYCLENTISNIMKSIKQGEKKLHKLFEKDKK